MVYIDVAFVRVDVKFPKNGVDWCGVCPGGFKFPKNGVP